MSAVSFDHVNVSGAGGLMALMIKRSVIKKPLSIHPVYIYIKPHRDKNRIVMRKDKGGTAGGNEITVEPKTKISANRREINQCFFVGGHFSILSGLAVRSERPVCGLRKGGGRLPARLGDDGGSRCSVCRLQRNC